MDTCRGRDVWHVVGPDVLLDPARVEKTLEVLLPRRFIDRSTELARVCAIEWPTAYVSLCTSVPAKSRRLCLLQEPAKPAAGISKYPVELPRANVEAAEGWERRAEGGARSAESGTSSRDMERMMRPRAR